MATYTDIDAPADSATEVRIVRHKGPVDGIAAAGAAAGIGTALFGAVVGSGMILGTALGITAAAVGTKLVRSLLH